MIHKEEHECKVNCPADKFYGMFKHNMLDLPKAMPGSYKSVKVLEGDGKSVGTVRLWTYVLGDDPTKVLTVKEQLEELDDENMCMTLRILEGEVMEDYKSLATKLSITPATNGGCLVKWVMEFEKKHDHSPHPHAHVDLLALGSCHFDALLNKPAKVMHKEEHEAKIKCPADKFYGMFKHDMLDLPKTLPSCYKGVKVLEGDGKSVGTVRQWSYTLDDDPTKVLTGTDRVEEVDDVNKRITLRVLDGDLMEDYESFVVTLSVTPTSDGGSLVKWIVEFQKKHDHSPHPDSHVDVLKMLNSHLDALLHQPAAE